MEYTYIRRNSWRVRIVGRISRDEIIKKIKNKRRIRFLRHQWWKFKKFINNLKWKKPKGIDNPMRLKLKGHPPMASVGFRVPKDIRGYHPSGLKPVVVHNVKELSLLNPAEVIIYVGRTVGARKKSEIIAKAKELGFVVANEGGIHA